MDKERNLILLWAEQRRVEPGRVEEAMRHAHALPDGAAWRRFIDRLLLWSGTTLVAAGVIYFIAFNWELLGHFLRFGLVEALIAIAVAACLWLGLERPAGKAALFAAALLLGALLALFGQTYQTGADTFELFVAWTVMLLPWALAGRHGPLWMLLVILANVAILFYFRAHFFFFGSYAFDASAWWLFGFNTAALVAWELAARRLAWLTGRWGPRLLASASGTLITTLAVTTIFSSGRGASALLVYALWCGVFYYVYRRWSRDLFMLAGGVLSAVVVVTSLLAEALFDNGGDEGALLLIALAVIGMSAAGGRWLMGIAREEAHEGR